MVQPCLNRFFVSFWHPQRRNLFWMEKPNRFMLWTVRNLGKRCGRAAIGQDQDIPSLENVIHPGIQEWANRRRQAKLFFYLSDHTGFRRLTKLKLPTWQLPLVAFVLE